ncbi:unnamed protein product, partial [Symbiodinium pilosum]
MASTPVSSIASSATNVADVLASLGNDELAAEVGSWSAELQAKVVAAVSALSSTPTSTSASTAVRRRKSNKLDAASSSTAASWLAPAVAPAELTAELAAIQEGDRSPAATGDNIDASAWPDVPAEVLMAKRPPTELRQPGPEPAPLQRQIAAEMSNAAQETGNWGRAGDGGGLGNFPSPEEARAKPAHRHDRHGPLLLTGPAGAAGSTSSSS